MNIEDHQKILSECHARHERELASMFKAGAASRDDEIDALTLRIKLAEGNVQRHRETYDFIVNERNQLEQQLAESQAREAKLRDAFYEITIHPQDRSNLYVGMNPCDIARVTLALPQDDTALREWGAKLVAMIGAETGEGWMQEVAANVRNGEVKP